MYPGLRPLIHIVERITNGDILQCIKAVTDGCIKSDIATEARPHPSAGGNSLGCGLVAHQRESIPDLLVFPARKCD